MTRASNVVATTYNARSGAYGRAGGMLPREDDNSALPSSFIQAGDEQRVWHDAFVILLAYVRRAYQHYVPSLILISLSLLTPWFAT